MLRSSNYAEQWLIAAVIALISFGVVMQYSAAGGEMSPWAGRQLAIAAFSMPILIFATRTSSKFLMSIAYPLYGFSLLLLVLVLMVGHTAMGATRWLNLGVLRLQPAELIKLSLILALARYYNEVHNYRVSQPLVLVPALLLVGIPFLLIAAQPDLGTGIIVLAIGVGMIFAIGVSRWLFIVSAVLILGSAPVLWHMLHDYQKQRILTFLYPERDPLGAGYNIIQSKIAIGAGGWRGQGLVNGSQSQLAYLPEHHTDFAFTMLAEELGFAGGAAVIGLFMVVICYSWLIAVNSKTIFTKLSALGASIFIAVHVAINLGMVMGLLPVVGVPLPFISYGGTMMVTVMLALAIIINAGARINQRA